MSTSQADLDLTVAVAQWQRIQKMTGGAHHRCRTVGSVMLLLSKRGKRSRKETPVLRKQHNYPEKSMADTDSMPLEYSLKRRSLTNADGYFQTTIFLVHLSTVFSVVVAAHCVYLGAEQQNLFSSVSYSNLWSLGCFPIGSQEMPATRSLLTKGRKRSFGEFQRCRTTPSGQRRKISFPFGRCSSWFCSKTKPCEVNLTGRHASNCRERERGATVPPRGRPARRQQCPGRGAAATGEARTHRQQRPDSGRSGEDGFLQHSPVSAQLCVNFSESLGSGCNVPFPDFS